MGSLCPPEFAPHYRDCSACRKQVAAAGHELVEEYIDDGFGDYEAF